MVRILRKLGVISSLTLCISFLLYVGLSRHPKFVHNTVKSEHRVTFIWDNKYFNAPSTKNKSMLLSDSAEQKKAQKKDLPPLRVKDIKYNKAKKVWEKEFTSNDLIKRLQNQRKYHQTQNRYKVDFNGTINQQHNQHDLLCQLKERVNMTTLKSPDLPDNASSWSQYLPTKDIHEVVGKLKRCAVVSSAAAIKGSKLGEEIDSHDAVLRFNAAPTKGYESDVGSKTTFRLINSQVVTQRGFNFQEDPIYKDVILILWDPAPYNADTYQWYQKPEYTFFEPYQKYRMENPQQPFYIMKPQTLWQLWNIIQENAPELITPNPPSSGSIGILWMMNICDEVNVYEFLPSSRQSDKCYYFRRFYDSACTFGAYHPLIYEKNLFKKLNLGTEEDLYQDGKVTLPGIRDLQCFNQTG